MRTPRIYHPQSFALHETINLTAEASHHLAQVLRMQADQPIILFNGDGYNYQGTIHQLSKKNVSVTIDQQQENHNEAPINIHLAQVMSRGDKMDFIIQKAVELGVKSITPLFSERCTVKLKGDRQAKKLAHWQRVIIAACEQCGRSVLPELQPISDLYHYADKLSDNMAKIIFHPAAKKSLNTRREKNKDYSIIIGSEGGLSNTEVTSLEQRYHFTPYLLGPRVLRTETAGLVALTLLQTHFGDL